MTQPAKTQEPSMEEILASIRRIIADDEAKPGDAKTDVKADPKHAANDASALAVKPLASVKADASARPQVMSGIPPSQLKVSQPTPGGGAAPVASNSQDDIDAMLADLDMGTAEADVRPAQTEDVFELTEQMAVEPPPAGEADDDLEFSEPAPLPPPARLDREARPAAPAYQPPPPPAYVPQSAPAASSPVMSQSTVFAVEQAFNSLASTVLSNNARTLEDLVKEMLRPMLKSWLDDNLPGLVERLVRAEIERVSRGSPR